jgi:predicted nucleotidyltransferase component of viral defense system
VGVQRWHLPQEVLLRDLRFSEDLDFTLLDASHVDETALRDLFVEITEWIYNESGIEFPEDVI